MLSGLEQVLPAMGQTPPKLAIAFVDSPRGLGVTFLNLVFKEIIWFEHYNHHDKMSPAWTGLFSKAVTRTCRYLFRGQAEIVRGH